jgi:DNA processing protein
MDIASPREPTPALTLLHAPGLGPQTYRKLVGAFGTAAQVLSASREQLLRHGLKADTIDALLQPDAAAIETDLRWAEQDGNHILTPDDPRWPALLHEIADAPIALFVRGQPERLNDLQLAIVGSRNPSASGRQNAHDFAAHLAAAGFTITSGLALGIDAAAHRGALETGCTIAVTGTGLDRVYPATHRDLAHAIAENGALVSELPIGVGVQRNHFPRRNRLISALSIGTLVVEAALKSGSLITAHQAIEQGREVFAIPGSIHNPLARGCHRLIRDGAKLVETAADIIAELAPLAQIKGHDEAGKHSADIPAIDVDNDPEYQVLLQQLDRDPVGIDVLVDRTGLTPEVISSMLLILELQGVVATSPGGHYHRVYI